MSVLYVGLPHNATSWLQKIYHDFASALGEKLPHRLYDLNRPPAGQFKGIDTVVESGGSFATSEMIDEAAAQGVGFWQIIGTGIDHVDVGRFQSHRIRLANLPGIFSSIALAEHALFGMLFFAKNYVESQRALGSRILCDPVAEELSGKTLSLVGFGASGRELARRAAALGLRIMALDAQPPDPVSLGDLMCSFLGTETDLDFLLSEGDYVSLHLPLNSSTHHMIDRRALSFMKPTAVLINVARGKIVEEPALIEALRKKSIRGAVLDVFAKEPVDPKHPFLQMKNVLATPHTAGVTSGTSRRRTAAAVENILRVHRGEAPLYLVAGVANAGGVNDREVIGLSS